MKALLPLLALGLASCASTTFQSYEGASVTQGSGGTRTNVQGIDFWENGAPPRKFRVIGIIDDNRPGGIIPMRALKSDVAAKAKAAGADAVVLIDNASQITGFVGNAQSFTTVNAFNPNLATTNTFGSTTPVRRNSAKFAAITYL
jgi:hypothetical protein